MVVGSSAGLLMTTDTSLDESVFGGDHAYSKAADKQRQRHSSEDGKNIFRPRRLSAEFQEADIKETEDSDSKRTTLIADTENTEDVTDAAQTSGADSCSDSKTDQASDSISDSQKLHTHSTPNPSPSHSIRTPVTENDPLGLLSSDKAVDSTATSTATTTVPSSEQGNRPTSEDARSTNDSGFGDIGGTAGSREKLPKASEEQKSDCQSTTSSESNLSSPCSPGWKPVHTSLSDQQIDSKGPPTPPLPSKSKSATLPTGSTPKSVLSRASSLARNESFTGVLHTAASGFMSRFRQLKDSVVTTQTPGKGPAAEGSMGSNTSLPKAHETEKHLHDDDDQQQQPSQEANASMAPAFEVTTFEERVPAGYKSRMKYQLQKTYSPFGKAFFSM